MSSVIKLSPWMLSATGSMMRLPPSVRNLLHLRAKTGRVIHVNAHLIECKLALQNQAHLDNAHEQLDNGLRLLIACFVPAPRNPRAYESRTSVTGGFNSTASSPAREVKQTRPGKTIAALERLTEGYYSICWQATAATFWCDSNDSECTVQSGRDSVEGRTLRINNIAAAGISFGIVRWHHQACASGVCSTSVFVWLGGRI